MLGTEFVTSGRTVAVLNHSHLFGLTAQRSMSWEGRKGAKSLRLTVTVHKPNMAVAQSLSHLYSAHGIGLLTFKASLLISINPV